MKMDSKENIKIKQVLMNGSNIAYVEFYSHSDNRNHIINAERFCDVFGVSMDELETFNGQRTNKKTIGDINE